jgi:ABC-type sugar transport system ATPase subunit
MIAGAPHLVVRQASKRFGAVTVLDRVDLKSPAASSSRCLGLLGAARPRCCG